MRLVPLYMVQDTQAAGSDIPEASGVTCIKWQTWRGGNLVDPFFVSLSGVPQEDAFLQHRHRVLSSTKTWRGVEQWSSVCTAEDRTPYRLESLRRAEKKSASYLPSWRAAKLLECGLPDDPPPPPSKGKKKRKLTKGKGKKHAPSPPKAPVVKDEDPRLVGVNVWDLRELNEDEATAAKKLHESRPEGYEVEEVQERTTRGKKRELDEEPEIEFLERPPEPRPDEVDLPLELEVLDEDMSNALIEALAAVRSTESGSRYWRSWSDDGGYSSEEDEAGTDSAREMNLNLTWSRRWRLHETASPRRRRRDRQSVHAPRERVAFVSRRSRATQVIKSSGPVRASGPCARRSARRSCRRSAWRSCCLAASGRLVQVV